MRFSYLLAALAALGWIACGCSAAPQPEDDRMSPTSAAWATAVVLSPGIFNFAMEDTVWAHNGMEGPGAADWRTQLDFDGNRVQHDEHVTIFRTQSYEVDDILTAFISKPPELMGQPAGEIPEEAPPEAPTED